MRKNVLTRVLSMFLALVMVLLMIPATVVTAFAKSAPTGVPEELVDALTEILGGDEERARKSLQALYDAGLIDENGNMVDLDIREDGKSVDLAILADRISSGEKVGDITVNGNETTPEKILQLRQVSSMLEVIHLIDRDVEITDEHIANLESLIEGIADGSIDLSDIIDGGKVDLNAKGGALRGTSRAETLPANQGTGEAEATDGRYTAPYISGREYNQNYSFSLLDPDNTTWYTERTAPDGVVTLSCNETASVGSTFTVTATLNKVQPVAVSFDWKAVSDVLNLTGTTSGTVTWEANDTQLTKTFSFGVNKKSNWYGSQCFVINAGNAKNATFGDGKTVWSQTVQVIRNSDADRNAVTNEYPTHNYSYGFSSVKVGDDQYNWAVIDQMPAAGDRFIISFSWLAQDSASMWAVDPSSFTPNASSFSNFGSANRYRIGRGGESPYQRSTTLTEKDTNVANKVKNGKLILVYQHNWEMGGFCYISGVSLKVPYVVAIDEVVGVSAPAGTYYSGQVVPVTVTLKEHAIATAGTTLTVNGVECPMLNEPGTEAKTFTFAYTVKETDTGAINVTELSDTFVNGYGDKVDFETAFPPASIGADEGVALSPDVKAVGLDWDNVKYGIDDAAPGQQVVTVVVPFKADANKTWIVNETEEINPALDMAVPGYPNATAAGYLRSAYFSADGGTTRYPVYVIGENADVLVARFAAPVNATSYLRLDNLCLYLDPLLGTTAEYFGTEHTDAKGYSYFTATENIARAAMGKSVSYYVRASVLFDSSETVARPGYDEANIMKNAAGDLLGLYKDGTKYIVVQNGNYDRQYDVELWVNEALYTAISEGIRSEDSETLILNYQFSDRRDFTFTGVEQFSWTSSDKKIAKVVKDEATGAAQILLNGVGGEVTLTLTVGNGANRNAYDISFTITVLEGKSPFLSIPDFSKERTTLTEIDTDVLFSSNVTARNAALEKNTAFTAKLYRVSAVGEAPSGDPIWTGEFESTEKDPLTHVTVPGDRIEEAGIYAVVVGTRYEGGIVDGVMTNAEDLSATAYLRVKQAPLKVTLNQLDSYSADYQNLPTIEYTIKPANASANAVVEYTIQKSGEAVSERRSASGGVIPFTATKPEGLKDAYTITVYARSADASADEAWSVDSMLLRVYNMDVLELVVSDVLRGEIGGTTGGVGENANGTTVEMDNHDKLEDYGITGDSYQLTVSDLNALRTDMSLQKLISANYGSGIWGLLSDKMQWTSSDSDLVSINYKQGGIYSDINNYSYTSYGPATDFLLVGKGDTDGVTITATHAGTGATASITVAAHTLTNQLFIFQFFPKVETDVIYTNGDGVKRTLKSDENGVLAVYEPAGIGSAVMAMSKVGGETYVGTIFANRLESGERDIASLQLYPTNNLRLRSVSGATLTFLNPDGSVYNGTVSLRVGVYKNGVYCPDVKVFLAGDSEGRNGREDVIAEVVDGKLTLGFDPTSFKNDPDDAEETGAYPGDRITYVIEYRVGDYETGYTIINAVTDIQGEQDPMDSVIELKTVKGGGNAPQIIRQTIQQYTDNKPVAYTRDVINYTENIGLSNKFNKVVLTTDFVLPSSTLSLDADGHTVLRGDFAFYTVDGRKLTGQTDYGVSPAVTIENLADLSGAELFVFPFSAAAFGRLVYTMTDDNMKADGITDEGENPPATARIKLMFVRDGMAVTSLVMPFGVANLSHQQDLTDENGPAKDTATDIQGELSGKMSIGDIFNSINVNDMLKKGFAFLGGLSTGGDVPLQLMIIPTENPGVFRIVAFVGSKPASGDENDLTIDYNSEAMYEALTVDDKGGDDDDDDDDDDSGEVKYSASFSGTVILEAGYDISAKKWTIDFIGGSVGLGFSIKYEWSQNFLAGPVPVNISFEVGAHAELEVSFANKSTVKLMLVDATIGVSIEAFAGIGFDSSIATLKLGIYGSIGADVNFLMLTDFKKDTSTGTKLTINGEIGIRFEIKVLFIKYKTTLASTSFNWTRKWNRYDEIRQKWENDGFVDLTGYTRSGRAYVMRLMSDGSALVAIESGGELEDRDYLELGERAWNSGIPSGRRLLKGAASKPNALTNVQTNAYPYSNPVFVDDGSMFLYISDNDNADELQNVVSYAVSNGTGYDNMGPLYPTDGENAVLADSDVVASGTGNNVFAAWVKQSESPEKEMNDKTNYDDLGMMMNATEIYVGAYNGTAWTTTRLTDNSVADMAPTIASRGSKAIAAWRSLSATQMPENGGGQDFTAMFDAENNINYSVYDGTKWADAKVAYNGSAGTVTAINSAMLADGTSILVYTVRTGDDVTTTETYYTVIDADGNAVTTGRLTSDEYIDTNAQVTAIGDRFVVGWYSEHDTGVKTVDPDTGDEQNVTAHDIRLACIHANGSVDESFPESIGGGSATGITSDFRFSAPADIDELSKLSIVWSQAKDSEDEEDDGKYELNAVRFYEKDGYIGVTSPITIAETDKNFTVDHFDTYTDEEGKVHVLVLGSDYNSLEGLAEYDTIDLSNQPIETGDGSQLLTILDQNPLAYIKLGAGEFSETAIEVKAGTNLKELVPGIDLPVQFTVRNTGVGTVEKVAVQLGDVNKTVEGLSLLPGQSATVSVMYPVPEGAVSDVAFTVTADDAATVDGTLILNRPDVGITGMKVVREENGERDIRVVLSNQSGIPLAGSGKTVKLAFYRDSEFSRQIGETVTIPADGYADIDDDFFVYNQTLRVEDLIDGAKEIPDSGIRVYAKAWVEEENGEPMNELYSNNTGSVFFKGLLTRNNGRKITSDTFVEISESGYTVSADIRNNSLQPVEVGVPVAVLLDAEGHVIAQKNLSKDVLHLGTEERRNGLSVAFAADEVEGTPASAEVRFISTITYEVCDGSGEFADAYTDINGHAALPQGKPTPPESDPPVYFKGWFTAPSGGEQITDEYTYTENTTLYAQYGYHRHVFAFTQGGDDTIIATCVNDEDDCSLPNRELAITILAPQRATGYGNPNATVSGGDKLLESPTVRYYTANENGTRGEALTEAPTAIGKYWAEFTLGGLTAHVVYEIAGTQASYVAIPNFQKISSAEEMDGASMTDDILAKVWAYLNAETLNANSERLKVISIGSRKLPLNPKTDEKFEDGILRTFHYCLCGRTYDEISNSRPDWYSAEEMNEIFANGEADVYIAGSDSTQVQVSAVFTKVNSVEELSALKNCSALDAWIWIAAHRTELRNEFQQNWETIRLVYELSEDVWDEYYSEWNYNYLSFNGSVESGRMNAQWVESMGFPVYAVTDVFRDPNTTYTVHYDANGGTGTLPDDVVYFGSDIPAPGGDGLSKANLVFDGWNTKADGSGTAYAPGDTVTVMEDMTLYARWKHVHEWTYTYDADSATYTAKCAVDGCTLGNQTLRVELAAHMYDGENALPYVCSGGWTKANGLVMPTIIYYKDGNKVAEAKNVGTYTAKLRLKGIEALVGEFSVTPRPIIITADDKEMQEGEVEPEFTVSYSPVGTKLRFDNDEAYPWLVVTDGDRVYAKSGNAGKGNTTSTLTLTVTLTEAGKLSFDYKYGTEDNWDWARFKVDGSEKFSFSNVGDWRTYSCDLSVGTHTLTWSYSKDGGTDKNGDFFAVDSVFIETDGNVTQSFEEKPDDTVSFDCLIADFRFENDGNYPWTEVTEGDRTFVKSGNENQDRTTSALKLTVTLEEAGTLSFDYKYGTEDYCDWCYFYVDGNEMLKVSNVNDWSTYSCDLSAGDHVLTWSYVKDANTNDNGDFFAIDNLVFTSEGTVAQPDFEERLVLALNRFDGGIVEGETLAFTVSHDEITGVGTYKITVTPGDNPNYEVREVGAGTLTVTEFVGLKQTIEADDVTATYGDAGVKINAAITEGDGTLGFKVKSGDAVTVDEEGNLTIVKAGTAVIAVTASQTETYALATKYVTVTINPKAMTVTAEDVNATVNGTSYGIIVNVTDPAAGYTVKYGTAEGTYNLTTCPTISAEGTLIVYYEVTADNYVTFTGSATVTLINHAHELTYTVGTGDDANTITAICSNDDSCSFPNNTATLTISTPEGTIVYDGNAHPAIITDVYGIQGDAKVLYAVKGEGGTYGAASETAPVNAGTYKASITLGTGDNAVTVSVEYEIGNAALTDVSVAQDGTLTYNGTAQTPVVTEYATAVNCQSVTFTYSLTADGEYGEMPVFTDVAEAGIVYFKASAPNHDDVFGSFTVTMNKANQIAPTAPTLDAATANRIKLTEVEGCEYSMDGENWQDSATFTGLTKNTEYTFYQRIKETANYNASPVSAAAAISTGNHDHEWGDFEADGATITAVCGNTDGGHSDELSATMTITAPTLTVYGGTGSAEATVINNIEGIDTPIIVYRRGDTVLDAAPTDAGTYTANITLGGATASVTYTIEKKAATVTAANKSKTYGAVDPTLTATVEGLVGIDTINYTLSRTAGENVGKYDIIVTLGENPNYDVTVTGAKLTIGKKAASVTAVDKQKIYGDADPEPTATVEGTVGTDTLNYTLSRTAGENVGEYVITVTLGENPNYDVTVTNAKLTIGKKAATVIAADQSKTYGDEDPDLTATALGTVGTDAINYTLSRAAGENVGEYVITVTLGENPNYDVTVTGAKLTIGKKAATVTAADKQKTYGDSDPELTATVAGTVGTDTINYTLSRAAGENAGEYAITVTLGENPNYDVTVTNAKLTIGKKAATVTAADKSKTYGDSDPELTATVAGTVGTDTINYTLSRAAGESAGEYVITVTLGENPNYDVTVTGAKLTIGKKAASVTAANKSKTYGDEDPTLTATALGTVGTDAINYTLSRTAGENVGEYAITVTLGENPNYDVTVTGAKLTIGRKAATVTAVDKQKTYGEADPMLTATVEGTVGTDTINYTLSRTAGENVGEYAITVTLGENPNYDVTVTGAKLTIGKRAVTVTADEKTIKYGQDLPTYTFTLSEEIAAEVLVELQQKTAFACDGDNLVPGKYDITLSFVDGVTGDNALENYTVTLENAYLYVLSKVLADTTSPETSAVEILLEDSEDAFDYNISVEVEIITTTDTTESTIDYNKVSDQYVNRRSEISKVYSIKLFRTEVVDGVETITEVQPSDIKEGMSIIIKMEIPEYLAGRNFRILHIHSENDIEYIDESNIEIKDGYVYAKINRLSEFAFVHLKDSEEMNHKGFCLGWLVVALDIAVAAYFAVYMLLKRKKLLNIIGLCVSGAVLAFALIVLILHICYVSIIGFVLSVLLFAAFLTFFFIKRKVGDDKPTEEDKQGSEQKDASPVSEATDVAAMQVMSGNVAEEDEAEDGGVIVDASGNIFNIRYKKSFLAKLIQSPEETKRYYTVLKNEVLAYDKTRSSVSWACDSVTSGRNPILKFAVRGKTLCVYFALNANDYADSKYRVEKAEAAKYESVPCLYRIKNDRRLGYAKDLIAAVCEKHGLTKGETPTEDYTLPYETTKALIGKGLIKEVKTVATNAQIERARESGKIKQVSVQEADAMISDEIASTMIEGRTGGAVGKKAIVNVDALSQNFNDGDTVTIECLKEKKLVPSSTKQVKLLARGILDKKLHVELQDYSIEAVKMVIALGGTVKRV